MSRGKPRNKLNLDIYKDLPDSSHISRKDLMCAMGFKCHKSLTRAIKNGTLPAPNEELKIGANSNKAKPQTSVSGYASTKRDFWSLKSLREFANREFIEQVSRGDIEMNGEIISYGGGNE